MSMTGAYLSAIRHTGDYRQLVTPATTLVRFRVCIEQSDLLISALDDYSHEAHAALTHARQILTQYAAQNAGFYAALTPLPAAPLTPPLVATMLNAGHIANVGPMAAVAGAIAQYVGQALLAYSEEVIVENGGDVFVHCKRPCTMCILAESSPAKILRIKSTLAAEQYGICTSSGKLGPSLSFGASDSVTVLAEDTAVADALATSFGNMLHDPGDVAQVVAYAKHTPALGLVIIMHQTIAMYGALELVD